MAYDGTAYYGFQRQKPEQITIQSALETALSGLAGQPVQVTGSGRTDRGVHAQGQVIAFNLSWKHGPQALERALNANLPPDIVVRQVAACRQAFHPRYDALSRIYQYRVQNGPVRDPVQRHFSWFVRARLDEAKMNLAAQHLVGQHDFATFGQPTQGEVTVRHVFRAEWRRAGENLTFDIEANAFLYRMVRSLVGTLKLVGEGRWTVDEFVAAWRACDRARAGMTAPPHGLFLVAVAY